MFNRHLFALLLGVRLVAFVSSVPSVSAAEISFSTPQAVQQFVPEQFLTLANQAREARSISALHLNEKLNQAALAKAEDMINKGYWDHFRPTDGKKPWDFIKEAGYQYTIAGENLARGFRTPAGITSAWMASPTHRANMLSAKYSEVGFACIENVSPSGEKVLLTVEMFGSR